MSFLETSGGGATSALPTLSFPSTFNSAKIGSENTTKSTRDDVYLLSEYDKRLISDLKRCMHVQIHDGGCKEETLKKRKEIGDNLLSTIKSKLPVLFSPLSSVSISSILGTSGDLCKNFEECFQERVIIFDLLIFMIQKGHEYAASIREDSIAQDSLSIVDLEDRDFENSWKTMFILLLFDVFFEEEVDRDETSTGSVSSKSFLNQLLERFSSIEGHLVKEASTITTSTTDETIKRALRIERSYLIELTFHCCSKFVPLNMSEWNALLSTISMFVSSGPEETPFARGLLLFSIIDGFTFHSPHKPMYDLVRSRLPHRQDYFSSKDHWNSWLGKMENWISVHTWTDNMFKHTLSLGLGLFLRMSREVRTLKGGLPPTSRETPSYMGALDFESNVSDSLAIEGILGEKSVLVPKIQKSLFSIFSEQFLPSTLEVSKFSPWGYDTQASELDMISSKWEGYVCESLMHLSTSILIWGSTDWVRGGKQHTQTTSILESFCDMIGAIFSYSGLPIYSSIDRRRPFFKIDTSMEQFWISEKATFFIRSILSSVGASSPDLSSSALRMLIGLAHGPISSMYAFDLLQQPSEYSASVLTWNNLFAALERYHVALAVESGNLSPSEAAAIELMLVLLQTICKYQPSCITKLLTGDVPDAASPFLSTLFGIISSKVPTSIKAQILLLLGEWMKSPTEGPANASLVWAHLEASQIVPTLAIDSMTISLTVLGEELASPLSVSLGGVLQECYQVEAPIGTYPVTYSLLHFLFCLINQWKIDQNLVISLSSSLGVGSRRFPGLWPYIKFVLSGALIPICTGPSFRLSFLHAEEKMAMIDQCVSILNDVLELKIIQNFHSIINTTGLLSIFFGIGTMHGEILGLPSLETWVVPSKEECSKPLVLINGDKPCRMVSFSVLQFLFTQLRVSKIGSLSPSSTMSPMSYSEEAIIIGRPQFLAILAQIISTNNMLDLVLVSIDLLKELLVVPKVESILRSVLGKEGMENFSIGIARWFGDILFIEHNTYGIEISTKVGVIKEKLLLLLSSQLENIPISCQSVPSSIQISINTTSILLGLHHNNEDPTLLLVRLVSHLLVGDFSPSSLLYSICKVWDRSEMLRNSGADPFLLLQVINEAFSRDQNSLPLALKDIGNALHLVAWMSNDLGKGMEILGRSKDTIYSILSQLLSIVPASKLVSFTSMNEASKPDHSLKYQQIHNFLQGHSHSMIGLSLLLPEPNHNIIELVVDALGERGSSWSISILDTLTDLLSRGNFNNYNGGFVKLCSLFSSIAPKNTSDFALGRLFTALNLALFTETTSLPLSQNVVDGLSYAILENFSSSNCVETCRLACSILLDSRNLSSVEQMSKSLRRLLSPPSKLEELIRESLLQSEKKDQVVFIEFISSLFSVFRDDPQVLTSMVQLLASSGYPSYIHYVFKNTPTSLQFLPLLEVAFYMVEFSSFAGASTSAMLRSCIGQLLVIPLEKRPDEETYPLILSLKMATNIVKGISMLSQHSASDLKMISSLHEKSINILQWFFAQSSELLLQVVNQEEIDGRSNILDLLVVLVNYFLAAHRAFTLSGSFSELLSEDGDAAPANDNKRILDICCANILLSQSVTCGMEQVLMLVWLTLGSLYGHSDAIPASFFSDLQETLSPKLCSLLSTSKERGSKAPLQYSTSLANEIRHQFLSNN